MDALLGALFWLLLAHIVARRGRSTGLFYYRVFLLALVPFLFPFVFVWVFWRSKRPTNLERYRNAGYEIDEVKIQEAIDRSMQEFRDRERDK
jgi:hypothetical protein